MIGTGQVVNALGGRHVFPYPITSDIELFDVIREGFPVQAIDNMIESNRISREEIFRLVISPRTLSRRKKESKLTAEESDRLTRVARIIAYSSIVFGEEDKADKWLRRNNRALSGRKPIDMLDTEAGARLIENILANIVYGNLS